MAKRTSGDHIVTSGVVPLSNYQPRDQDSLLPPSAKAPVSTISILPSQYAVANVTTATEEVVLVVNVGTNPKRDQIRELNAKLQGIITSPLRVSSEG
ncbi:MAG: hypothetical protein AABY62_00435 [Pseudomonadota bacterium]